MKHGFACLMTLALTAPCAHAQQPDPALQALAEARVRSGPMPGLVIGTIVGKETRIDGYGAVAKGGSVAPTGDTVYEIGSLTKTFTALLLADAADRGTLKLDDPVAGLLPDYRIPGYGSRTITVLDLATQSSGLPRLPANLAPRRADNPYADYGAVQLKAFLGSHALVRAPGAQYEYSNLGFGLLGSALAASAGKDYAALVGERIAGPLGMTRTGVALTADMAAHLAAGHDGAGKPVSNWDFASLAGAGALRSSAADMLRYLQAHMRPDTVAAAAGKPQRAAAMPGEQIGLAWHIRQMDGRTVAWHNGMTGGYASFMAFTADGERGVVVLANGAGSVDDLGFAALLPKLAGPVLPAALLEQYVGRYRLAPGMVMTISVADGGLVASVTGQPSAALAAGERDQFSYRVAPIRLQFERAADGAIKSLVVHQGGRAMAAPRMAAGEEAAPRHPKEIGLPVAQLRQYAGSYLLAPGFSIAVTEEGGRLYIQATGQARSEVFVAARDEVFSKIVEARISFNRNAAGEVDSLVLHQGGRDMPASKATD